MKKYKLTDEVNELGLHRIVALRDIPRYFVEKGDLGGFIESEKNLSQKGDAWVSGNAWVTGDARVYGNAWVGDRSRIICNACIFGKAHVYDNARICGNARISGASRVYGNALVGDNAQVYEDAFVYANVQVYGETRIYGVSYVYGNACISGNAVISNSSDYVVFQNWWNSEEFITWTRSNNMWSAGLFYGTGAELLSEKEKEGEISLREYKRLVEYVENMLKDESQDKKKQIYRDSKGRFCKYE